MLLQAADGQVLEAHSASAGLDYPGVGPQIAALAAAGPPELAPATGGAAFEAMPPTAEREGIHPAPAAWFAAAPAFVGNGADRLEVGFPSSAPLADGAALQRASAAALDAGATFDVALDLIARLAAARPNVPIVPMAYVNQIIGGGDGAPAARRLVDAGASGLIVADLTPDEGRGFEELTAGDGLALVYLAAPTTPAE